jgi:hypothetical protein
LKRRAVRQNTRPVCGSFSHGQFRLALRDHRPLCGLFALALCNDGYSILGITVNRKHALKCLFSQEKGTLHAP